MRFREASGERGRTSEPCFSFEPAALAYRPSERQASTDSRQPPQPRMFFAAFAAATACIYDKTEIGFLPDNIIWKKLIYFTL